ncbi:MAG: oligosaccharide flippase family protein [Paludibacteraceae bacterium]|nr:oligosaccharide flippase family protein [Paludibacteraceae bacterium]
MLTRFLTTEEVGLSRVMIDAATFFVGLAQLGTSNSIIRFFPYFKDGETNHGFFFWTLVVPFIGFVLFSIIYWVCHIPLAAWFGDKSPLFVHYYYLVLPIAFFMLYQTIFETNANVLMNIVVPRAVREMGTRIGLLIVYLLYAFRIISMDGFVISLCAVYAVCSLINLVYLFSLGKISLHPDWAFLRENSEVVRRYLLYTGFLIVSALASTVAPLLSSFFISAQMGLDYNGIFAIATYMAVMVSIPYRSVTAIASPELAKTIKEQDTMQTSRLMRQCAGNLLLIGGFILLLIWVNIDLIYIILPNGATYASARNVVLILGFSQLILATFNITLNTLNYSRFYAFSLLWSLMLTGMIIVLNNLLIPRYGMEGAAISNLLSYAFYFMMIVTTVCLTTHTSPFAWSQLKTMGLLVSIFVINELWLRFLPMSNLWLSSMMRTLVLLGTGIFVAYRLNLSEEINALFRRIFISRH